MATATVKFSIDTPVILVPLDVCARVLAFMVDRRGVQYLTRYWDNGESHTEWVFEDEITADRNNEVGK